MLSTEAAEGFFTASAYCSKMFEREDNLPKGTDMEYVLLRGYRLFGKKLDRKLK